MSRQIYIYKPNRQTGQIDKIRVDRAPLEQAGAKDFHQNVIDTYYQLECAGELKPTKERPNYMNAQTKTFIRDLNVAAQSPEYWGCRTQAELKRYHSGIPSEE